MTIGPDALDPAPEEASRTFLLMGWDSVLLDGTALQGLIRRMTCPSIALVAVASSGSRQALWSRNLAPRPRASPCGNIAAYCKFEPCAELAEWASGVLGPLFETLRLRGCLDQHRLATRRPAKWLSSALDGRINRLASRAYNLDPFVGTQFLPDGGSSQIGLPLHEACGRISERGGHAHHRRRIVMRAVPKVGCDCKRAGQDKRRQHRDPSIEP